jgi:hypothetical protein
MSRENGGWRSAIRRLLDHEAPPAPAVETTPSPAVLSETPEQALEAIRAMNAAPSNEARFLCARHGTEAAVVKLFRRYSGASELVVESYLASWHSIPVPEDEKLFGDPTAEAVQEALSRADVIGLHLVDARFTPFFCTDCAAVYCKECWTLEEVMGDDNPDFIQEVRALCPREHVNVLMRFDP